MPRKPSPIQFPIKGVSENVPYSQQEPQTTPVALNVRSYDSLERRNRGGQRVGMTKQSESPLNGSNQVQTLEPVVRALDLVQTASWGDPYSVPTVSLANFAQIVWHPDGDRFAYHDAANTGDTIYVFVVSGTTVTSAGHEIDGSEFSADVDAIAWHPTGSHLFVAGGSSDNAAGFFRAFPYDTSTGWGAGVTAASHPNQPGGIAVTPSGDAVAVQCEVTPYIRVYPWTGTDFGAAYSDPGTLPTGSGLSQGKTTLIFGPDGDVLFASGGSYLDAWEWDDVTGWGSKYTSPGTVQSSTLPRGISVHPSGNLVVRRGSTSDTEVFVFDKVVGWGARTTTATSGSSNPTISPNGNYLLMSSTADGNTTIYDFTNDIGSALTTPGGVGAGIYDVAWSPDGSKIALSAGGGGTTDRGVLVYDFSPAAINPTAREVRVVAVSGGSVYRSNTDLNAFSLVANGASAYDPSNPQIMADTAFQKLFIVDGLAANYQYLDFSDNSLKDWASDLTDGALPVGTTDTSLGARMIAVYRGRVVLAGLKEEPQNWFMSAAGDPFDWDYSPSTPRATQAVAGNNSEVGELGDVLTALAPFQDDLMVMGGSNTVWVMRGDPAAGGQIDNIVRGIGIVGPEAHCFDEEGNFYFFAVNGLYRIEANLGSKPTLISKNRLDTTFTSVDVSENIIRLVYDPIWQGVHVFITPSVQPGTNSAAPMHYFWDRRNDAFWPDQYPAAVGPTAVAYFAADNSENSGVFLGGFDSYVRRFDPNANGDDGVAISSRVQIPALVDGAALANTRLSEIYINLDQESSPVSLSVYAGATVEGAVQNGNLRFTRTLLGGRNNALRQRARGAAVVLEISQSTLDYTWAYESGVAVTEIAGKSRRRRL